MKLLPGLGLFGKARDLVTGEGEGGHIKPPKTLSTAGDFLDANKDQSAIEHMQEAQEAAGHKDQSAVEHMHEAAGHKDQSADKKEGEDDDSDAKKGDDKKNKNLKVDLANRNEHSILKDESVSANFKNTTADESPFNAFTKGEARSLFNKLSGKMKNHLNIKITELDEATHIKEKNDSLAKILKLDISQNMVEMKPFDLERLNENLTKKEITVSNNDELEVATICHGHFEPGGNNSGLYLRLGPVKSGQINQTVRSVGIRSWSWSLGSRKVKSKQANMNNQGDGHLPRKEGLIYLAASAALCII